MSYTEPTAWGVFATYAGWLAIRALRTGVARGRWRMYDRATQPADYWLMVAVAVVMWAFFSVVLVWRVVHV